MTLRFSLNLVVQLCKQYPQKPALHMEQLTAKQLENSMNSTPQPGQEGNRNVSIVKVNQVSSHWLFPQITS